MHKADGGGIDDSIDIDAGERFPGGLRDVMSDKQYAKDQSEIRSGARFSDSGTRIPGRLKGRNDDYDRKLKGRN